MQYTRRHDELSREALLALNEREGETCISLYMTEMSSPDKTDRNRILFKDLCKQAARKLEDYGAGSGVTDQLMAPLRALVDDAEFWNRKNREQGLAFFATPETLDIYQLAMPFTPHAIVDRHFFIRPLIRLVTDLDLIKLLLLNQSGTRFFHCMKDRYEEKTLPGYLRSLETFLQHHDFEKSLQFHDGGGAAGTPSYHGHGNAGDEATDNIYLAEYYKAVKNWMKDHVGSLETIYIAGDDRNYGVFSQVASQLPCELSRISDKNTRSLSPDELARRINAEKSRHQAGVADEALARFHSLEQRQPDKILREPAEVVKAAHNKRLDTLFLPDTDDTLWGTFDEDNQDVVMQSRGDKVIGEELINLAAIRGLQSNSHIILVDPDESAGKKPLFAGITIW